MFNVGWIGTGLNLEKIGPVSRFAGLLEKPVQPGYDCTNEWVKMKK